MKAVVITGAGGPEVLEIREVSTPQPGASEVLVRVMASALNRADILQREGNYPPPAGAPEDIPGLEFAGEVFALGPGAGRWRIGDRVFGIVAGGAHAQFVATHQDTLARIPASLAWEQAGAIPEAFMTAHDALWVQAGLLPGESVLIHSVGSGVGLAGVQLARAKGAIPFGTSRTAAKLERAHAEGMERGLVLREDFSALKQFAAEHTASRGFDVALDLVGGAYVGATIPAMAQKGRVLLVGTVAGARAEMHLGLVLRKRLTLRGTVMRARPLEEKAAVTQAFAQDVIPLLESRTARPVIDRTFDLADIRSAHRHLESNDTFGKVVLLIPH